MKLQSFKNVFAWVWGFLTHRYFLVLGMFFAIVLVFIPAAYYGIWKLYRVIDPMEFPHESKFVQGLKPGLEDKERGAALSHAMTIRLQSEMNSRFGWTPNDLIISPTRYLDRRNSRQMGTIFATRILVEFFSTNLSKYGKADIENESLKKARNQCFSYSEDVWWMASTEDRYEEGIKLVGDYAKQLRTGKATFNMRSDDIYNLLSLITSSKFLDQPLGQLVQTSDGVPFSQLEEHVYYAQGSILVVREFLHALVNMYPEITQKGGKENIQAAFRDMDKICVFDPLIVLGGSNDSMFADHRGKMARYMINVRERINDLAQSVRR
jgi:hypothetical protein